MKIKPETDLKQFFYQIHHCKGNVWFCTQEGDKLNLRSCLTQYIFVAAFLEKVLTLDGSLYCEYDTDILRLSEFIVPE
mgnify:CR=1 FL=1